MPSWLYWIYGLAVSTGLAGSIGLFRQKGWSVPLFATCLGAVLVQMVYSMLVAGGLQVMGPSALVMPVLVIVIAAALLWFAHFARRRSWI
jgi:hypothetical protein